MSGMIYDKKKIDSPWLCHMICALLLLLAAGCGDHSAGPADASRTGSASFSVQWQADNTALASAADAPARSAIGDCSSVGIESITCVVYDPSNTPIANGGPWHCTEGGGNMAVIPAGSNLTFTILGWDTDLEQDNAEGNIIYQGSTQDPVTIIAGETTDAGIIIANPFVPTDLTASAVSTSQIELTWSDTGASSYDIYEDGTFVTTSTSPSFSITDLTQNTEYCYTVSSVDVFDNESGQSAEDCATTGSEDDTLPPTVPTSVNAVAVSPSQINITWVASTDNVGVSGYRIYDLDGELVGTTAEPSFSHEGLQANITYCYTVVAFDATGNLSEQSAEDCATTSATADDEPPTQPQGLEAVAVTANQIDLSWTPSTDNVGVTRYRVYRGGEPVGWATSPTFSDGTVQPDIEYCYTVVAYDAADNVSERSAEACATARAIITVNIDRDFKYVAQGFPMGLSAGETTAGNLTYEPLEKNLIEPPYDDLYVQYTTRYGYFEMGNTQDSIISFVIVEDYSSTTPETYRIYIDSNNNEDLTDDGGPYASQGTTDFAVQVPLNADIITDSGNQITRPYQLWMWVIDNTIVRFYATCHHAGQIRAGGQTFTAVAFERFNHNALYRENGLFIDMDNDGRIDIESESFNHLGKVTVGGQPYELILDYP